MSPKQNRPTIANAKMKTLKPKEELKDLTPRRASAVKAGNLSLRGSTSQAVGYENCFVSESFGFGVERE